MPPGRYFDYIHYGTGTGTPSSTDTSLFAFSGYLPLDKATCDFSYAGHWYSRQRKGQLAEGVAVGQTLTEVGIAYSTSKGSLCTHAMLKDMNGNQISITKTDTDVINIYATVFVHWPESLVSGGVQIQLSSNATNGFLVYLTGGYAPESPYYSTATPPNYAVLTTRRGEASAFTTSSGSTNSLYQVAKTYHASTKELSLTVGRVPVASGNRQGGSSGIGLYVYYSNSNSSLSFPAFYLEAGHDWFPGSTIKGEAIGTGDGETMDFATAFDDPEAATVYIDGATALDAIVDCAPVAVEDMCRYFDRVSVENGIAYPGCREYSYTVSSGWSDEVYYNRYWRYGVDNFRYSIYSVSVSDDLINWDYLIGSEGAAKKLEGTFTVPEEFQHKKYWKLQNNGIYNVTSPALTGKNIHFATPPAVGAVITADYFTKRIAKDSNHVFDLTLTIQLGEHTM